MGQKDYLRQSAKLTPTNLRVLLSVASRINASTEEMHLKAVAIDLLALARLQQLSAEVIWAVERAFVWVTGHSLTSAASPQNQTNLVLTMHDLQEETPFDFINEMELSKF